MKPWKLALAAAVMTTWVGSVLASGGHGHMGKHPHPGIHGTVVKVENAKLTLRVTDRAGASKDVVVLTDGKTVISLDDKPSKLSDLKPGMWLHVESYIPDSPTSMLKAKTTVAKDPPKGPAGQ